MLGTGSANRATVSMLSVNAENTIRNLFEVKPPSIQCRVDYCFPHSAAVSICERNLKGHWPYSHHIPPMRLSPGIIGRMRG